eukprot:TRINITY_DN10309_c0_g1_i2.p2 TRINITY_DN10309_c0_g1~~TRINITY_DN10309_c0_g1_i2.p2  ORF type:complete len:104 (+),score=7.42 TRINITY_DN10309_c0_g1_i2:34-345(+)
MGSCNSHPTARNAPYGGSSRSKKKAKIVEKPERVTPAEPSTREQNEEGKEGEEDNHVLDDLGRQSSWSYRESPRDTLGEPMSPWLPRTASGCMQIVCTSLFVY